MKSANKLQVYVKAGILLAVFGTAHSATERVINQTTEIVTVRYETPKSNVSATNISVLLDETKLTDSPINLSDYEDSSEEARDEATAKRDSDGSTTQKYENSKMLFSYVVPVTSEKAPQVERKDEEVEEEDDSEDIAVDEEEEEEERGNLEEEEEEENSPNTESDEEEYGEEESEQYRGREEEEEEEEEEKRPYYRREDVIGGENYQDDSDEEHYETEEEDDHGRTDDEVGTEKGSTHAPINPWRHSYPNLIGEKKPVLDFTTVQPYTNPRPVSYSSVVYDPDGQSKTELSGSFYKKPLNVVPESGVFPTEEEHASEDTKTVAVTTQSVMEERSIRSPDEPIKDDEEEGYVKPEVAAPGTKQDAATAIPKSTQKPVQAVPRQNFDWADEEDYEEDEGLTSKTKQEKTTIKPKRTPKPAQPIPRSNFDWEEEEEDYAEPEAVKSKLNCKTQTTTTAAPKRTPKSAQPTPRHNFDWEEEEEDYTEQETVTSKTKQDVTTVTPKRTTKPPETVPQHNVNWQEEEEEEEDYIEPEAATTKIVQDSTTAVPKRIPKPGQSVPRYSFNWHENEPTMERYEEREYFREEPRDVADDQSNPKLYNEKASQHFRDKSNRENYYEQTVNTRFESKEKGTSEEDNNYESEVADLMKPKVEELSRETIQKNLLSTSEEDETEPEEMTEREIPTEKDRNQLYEYLIADGRLKQGVSENKESLLRHVLTTPKEEVVQTEPPLPPSTEPPKPKTTVTPKPQRYSFGTITNPQSDRFMTFNNGETNDVTYNRIVSNIQSLFTPATQRPTPNYEQRFLPSHGNCRHQLPDHHHDSINYESFIKPSQTRPSSSEEEDAEEEEEEEEEKEEESPMPRRLPMKTYIVQRRPRPTPNKEIRYRPVKRPSSVKVTVHPMTYREAKPVTYRNAVYLGPATSSNQLVRKIVYYTPREHQKKPHYSPTNQILRMIRPQPPSSRMLIIRKIEETPT